jgi:hypothetical protein
VTLSAHASLSDVALAVGATLRRHGISAVLTGGACAAVHAGGRYVSRDVDFVVQGRVRREALDAAMGELGFVREADRYVHPETPFYVEFLAGPLAVGGDHAVTPVELSSPYGPALALSPTDACRDRLAGFYHWNDRQGLAVAVLVAGRQRVHLAAIRRWSAAEGHAEKFEEFLRELRRARSVKGRGHSRRDR